MDTKHSAQNTNDLSEWDEFCRFMGDDDGDFWSFGFGADNPEEIASDQFKEGHLLCDVESRFYDVNLVELTDHRLASCVVWNLEQWIIRSLTPTQAAAMVLWAQAYTPVWRRAFFDNRWTYDLLGHELDHLFHFPAALDAQLAVLQNLFHPPDQLFTGRP